MPRRTGARCPAAAAETFFEHFLIILQIKYCMAFHIDCKGRHGLRSIDKKPASYQGWQCDACQRQIPDNCIGVLHCARCAVDICPACWTSILPKIVNAAGYPCFWVESHPNPLYGNHSSWQIPQGPTSILVCHRPDDCVECGMFISAHRYQCQECLTLTRTMQIGAGAARVAPPVPEAFPLAGLSLPTPAALISTTL
jgi:hypothetical protein